MYELFEVPFDDTLGDCVFDLFGFSLIDLVRSVLFVCGGSLSSEVS